MADLTSNLKQTFGMQFDNDGPISRASATLNLYYHQVRYSEFLYPSPFFSREMTAKLMILIRTVYCPLHSAVTPLFLAATPHWRLFGDHGTDQSFTTRGPGLCSEISEDTDGTSFTTIAWYVEILVFKNVRFRVPNNGAENFLPFDLESTFSSAFVLSLMAALPACPLEDTSDVDASFFLLNQMVAKGNVIAEFRRQDLEHLINLLHLVGAEMSQRNSLATNAIPPVSGGAEDDQTLPSQLDDVGVFNDLSPEQMLSLAGLLELDPTFDHVDEQWLWA